MAAPVLDIDTLVTRPQIKINGVLYGMKTDQELSILTNRRLQKISDRLVEIETAPEISDDDEAEYGRLTTEACRLILDAPADVIGETQVNHRVSIIVAFSTLRQAEAAKAAGAKPSRAAKPTGAKRSRS